MKQKQDHRARKRVDSVMHSIVADSRPSTVATSVNIRPGRKRKRPLSPTATSEKENSPKQKPGSRRSNGAQQSPLDLQTSSKCPCDTIQASSLGRYNPYTSTVFNAKPFDPKQGSHLHGKHFSVTQPVPQSF